MFDYEKIDPIFPGKHVEGWQKIRKSQWKSVKETLDWVFNFDKDDIKFVKQHIYLADQLGDDVEDPSEWTGLPMSSWFLNPDQSEAAWEKIWLDINTYKKIGKDKADGKTWIDKVRKRFLEEVHNIQQPEGDFGAFGGLEQRMLPYLIQSKVYTDETFEFGSTKRAVRKVPWQSPHRTHEAIISRNGKFAQQPVNPYSPIQWLHEMFVSTFQYDIEYSESSDVACLERYKIFLDANKPDELYHINHIRSAQRMIDIFEDETAPKYLRELWIKVRDGEIK